MTSFGEALVTLSKLPRGRGIGYSAAHLQCLWTWCRTQRPWKVLEFGSGYSTVLLALAMRENRHGAVLSLEEHGDWAERTRGFLTEALGKEAGCFATVQEAVVSRRAGFCDYAGATGGPWELLHVDGPELHGGELLTTPLAVRMAPNCAVIVDKRLTTADHLAREFGVMLYRNGGTSLLLPAKGAG